jgi:hypothetical protein
MDWGMRQTLRVGTPPLATLYFHPWEFDPDQTPLPLQRFRRFRTYVGIRRNRLRLDTLLNRHHFGRAVDLIPSSASASPPLPEFRILQEGE